MGNASGVSVPYDKGDAVECARTGIWQLFHGTARQGDKVERERERAVLRDLLGHHTCWLPCVFVSPIAQQRNVP